MRIAVAGMTGQLAMALAERGAKAGVEVVRLGRPELDLTRDETILPALQGVSPDVVINAAAYTAVDLAESEARAAFAVNAEGAGRIASAAARLGAPLLHVSTDYVFRGDLGRPYREDDATGPTGIYGASKLAGEQAVLAEGGSVFRTAWVYSPFGRNFVKTMAGLAASRDEVRVVADQIGSPTSALDIADALIAAARRQVAAPADQALRGVFHLAGVEAASWCALAQGVFDALAAMGRPACRAIPIPTSDYPTPARRPADSRLDGARLKSVYGLEPPSWRASLPGVVARLA